LKLVYGGRNATLKVYRGIETCTLRRQIKESFPDVNHAAVVGLSLRDGSFYPLDFVCRHTNRLSSSYNETFFLRLDAQISPKDVVIRDSNMKLPEDHVPRPLSSKLLRVTLEQLADPRRIGLFFLFLLFIYL
jgi:hypothetical protein